MGCLTDELLGRLGLHSRKPTTEAHIKEKARVGIFLKIFFYLVFMIMFILLHNGSTWGYEEEECRGSAAEARQLACSVRGDARMRRRWEVPPGRCGVWESTKGTGDLAQKREYKNIYWPIEANKASKTAL